MGTSKVSCTQRGMRRKMKWRARRRRSGEMRRRRRMSSGDNTTMPRRSRGISCRRTNWAPTSIPWRRRRCCLRGRRRRCCLPGRCRSYCRHQVDLSREPRAGAVSDLFHRMWSSSAVPEAVGQAGGKRLQLSLRKKSGRACGMGRAVVATTGSRRGVATAGYRG